MFSYMLPMLFAFPFSECLLNNVEHLRWDRSGTIIVRIQLLINFMHGDC